MPTATPVGSPARGDGCVLGLTRAGIWVLLVLAAANGVFLYLVPGLADTDYAWAIKPSVNAAFIGAGFLAGALATGLVLAATERWRTFSTLPPALWVLASALLAATIIHADRFSCAAALRRPADALIPYATLAAWSLLLLTLPVLHPDDVSGGGLWIALMLVLLLLGLSALALRVALPERMKL